ncbi:MAG: twin-arginine translocase subunit TatC [Muribaculaceae bacterium]|nr:twin-arginine translocase subunit TatC [Muribaculaceae bacterium]
MSSNSSSAGAEMGFWDHVDALRGVILRSGAIVLVLWVLFLALMPRIFDSFILAPCRADFPLYHLVSRIHGGILMPDFTTDDSFKVDLINIQLASQFFIHISTAFWLALTVSIPAILYFLWQFLAPALYRTERRAVSLAFASGTIMFFIGATVGYFIVFPLTLRFLSGYQVSELVPNQISLDSYMDNFTMLILMMGLMFELPLVAWLLGRLGLLSRQLFSRYRRHAIVALLVLAAIITPTGDPFTLMVVFLPVYMLWEAGALLVPREAYTSAESQQS